MALAEPYDRPRDFLARMAGLGRPVLWSLAATSLVSTVAARRGAAAGRVTRRGARPTASSVYVAYLDASWRRSRPVRGRRPQWEPRPGAWLDFARRWIRNLRYAARPTWRR